MEPRPQSMAWIPGPGALLSEGDDIRSGHPPIIAPPSGSACLILFWAIASQQFSDGAEAIMHLVL